MEEKNEYFGNSEINNFIKIIYNWFLKNELNLASRNKVLARLIVRF